MQTALSITCIFFKKNQRFVECGTRLPSRSRAFLVTSAGRGRIPVRGGGRRGDFFFRKEMTSMGENSHVLITVRRHCRVMSSPISRKQQRSILFHFPQVRAGGGGAVRDGDGAGVQVGELGRLQDGGEGRLHDHQGAGKNELI